MVPPLEHVTGKAPGRPGMADRAGSPGCAVHHLRSREGPGETGRLCRRRRRTNYLPARDDAGKRDTRRVGCVGAIGFRQLTADAESIAERLIRIGGHTMRAQVHYPAPDAHHTPFTTAAPTRRCTGA